MERFSEKTADLDHVGFELLGHRLARADIEIEPFSSRFSPKTTNI